MVCISANAKPKEISYELSCSAQPDFRFKDIKRALFILTSSDVDNSQIYDNSKLDEKIRKAYSKKVKFTFTPDLSDFFEESFKKYANRGGFTVGNDWNNDYALRAKLKEFKITDMPGGAPCHVVIEWELLNPEKATILNGEAKGKQTLSLGQSVPDAFDKAYEKALADIDWYAIADCLSDIASNYESVE